MTSSRDFPPEDQAIIADLEAIHATQVPSLRFSAPRPTAQRPASARWRWRGLAAGAAAASVVAAAIIVPVSWGGETTVSAEQIFERAAAYKGGESYHLVASYEAGSKSPQATTETWYVDATHQRTETHSTENGQASVFGFAQDGDHGWLYLEVDGTLRAAHFPVDDATKLFLPRGESLADVLAQYSDSDCQEVTREGEATVLGRTTHVISVRLTPENCSLGREKVIKAPLPPGGDLKLWVDAENFLTLRMEKADGMGSIGYLYEVTTLEIGGGADGVAYTPPVGALVAEVDSPGAAKTFIAPPPRDGAAPPGAKTATTDHPKP